MSDIKNLQFLFRKTPINYIYSESPQNSKLFRLWNIKIYHFPHNIFRNAIFIKNVLTWGNPSAFWNLHHAISKRKGHDDFDKKARLLLSLRGSLKAYRTWAAMIHFERAHWQSDNRWACLLVSFRGSWNSLLSIAVPFRGAESVHSDPWSASLVTLK